MNSGWRLKECGRCARKSSTSTCQATGWAALLHCVHGDTHPVAGARGPISQCQLDESPAHPLKTIAAVSKGVPRYGSTQLKRDLPGASEQRSEPKSGRRRPRRHVCAGPATRARPALHSPGEEFASDPAQVAADRGHGAQRLGLRDPCARWRFGLHGVPTSLSCPESREVPRPGRQEAAPVRTARSRPAPCLALLLRSLARSRPRLVRQIINCQALRARGCFYRSSPGTSGKLGS